MRTVSAEEAVAMIPNGARVMVGGFMGVGTPERLLDELVRQHKSELSLVCNDAAVPGKGVGKLIDASLVSTLTASHIGLNPKAQQQMMTKKIAVDLVPQGTLVERIRAGHDANLWINGGFFILRKEIFDYMREGDELAEAACKRLIEGRLLESDGYT